MAEGSERFFDFGPFTFSETNHVLRLNGEAISLSRRAADILAYLIENRHRWVHRDELKALFWKNVRVEDNSVDQQISYIRQALRQSPKGTRYIEVKYTLGWRFAANVTVRAAESSEQSINRSTETRDEAQQAVAGDGLRASNAPSGPALRSAIGNKWGRAMAAGIIIAISVAAFDRLIAPRREPRVVSFTPLTTDGRQKFGPLLTDGRRVFFVELIGGSRRLVSVPVSGGETLPLNIPLSQLVLQDISADGSKLLLHSHEAGENALWTYSVSTGSLRPLHGGYVQGAWTPDGSTLAASNANGSQISILRRAVEMRADLPGQVLDLKWAPDGKKLRFSLLDAKRESSSEWELDEQSRGLHRLASVSDGHASVGSGSWGANGRYFFYKAGTYLHQDIWVLRQSDGLLNFGSRKPVRLTNGGLESWDWPTPSSDASTIFAMNRFVRSELVRFDRNTKSWLPVWDGTQAYELDFAKDSKWVVYTHFPDHTIWKARSDGTARMQLTSTALEAHQPHWSPDGAQVAFVGKSATGSWRIFQVPANGGVPEELLSSGDDQGVPTWSHDGKLIMFGDLPGGKPRAQMSIHLLDLRTRKVSPLAGSKGLWSARWSPNGQYIAAITSDSLGIRILPSQGTHWTELVRMSFVDNVAWSADSRYIYFNGNDAGGHSRLFRVSVSGGRPECIADLSGFIAAPENWYGVAPDGTPLASRGAVVHEIFALKCVLP